MSYVLLDDKFHSHAKTTEVGNAGAGLFARALSYCGDHLTDGFVARGWAHEIGRPTLCRKLVAAGFWLEVSPGDGPFVYVAQGESYAVKIEKPGYFIPDYLALNPTRQSVLLKRSELSQKRSESGKKGAQIRWQREWQTDSNGHGKQPVSDGKPMANEWPPSPTPLKQDPRAVPLEVDAQPPDIAQVIDLSLGGTAA